MATTCTAIGFPSRADVTNTGPDFKPRVPFLMYKEGRTILGTNLTYSQAVALCSVWRLGHGRSRRTMVVFTRVKGE